MMGKKMGGMMSTMVKKEMKAGKPQKQAVAMAYSMTKPAKKAAKKSRNEEMIKSAAIIKNAPRAEWREVRLAKKKAKKQAQIERKAIKVYFPSPMNMRVRETEVVEVFEIVEVTEVVESMIESDAPPTREEMAIKARELGIKFDGRTSDKKLSSLIATALGG